MLARHPILVIIVTLSAATALAVPSKLAVQGRLLNTAGLAAPDGTYGLTVRLFDAAAAGDLLHEEAFGATNAVVVADGVFALTVGTVEALSNDLFVDNDVVWVELQVDLDPPLPRRPLTAVPWALAAQQASVALSAADLACSGCVGADELSFDPATQDELNAAIAGVITETAIDAKLSALADTLYTKTETDAALATLAGTVYTKAQTDDAIAALGSGVYTKTESDAALAALAAGVYTKTETDDAIAALAGTVYTKAEVDSKLAGYLPLTGGALTGSIQLGNDTAECNAAKAGAIRWTGTKFEGCDGESWQTISVIGAPSAKAILTGLVSGNPTQTMGQINPIPGKKVRILKVGICGDSEQSSGPNGFRLQGNGINITFGAGASDPGVNYFLGVTPNKGGQARGFVYGTVGVVSAVGATVTLSFISHSDYDGLYCVDVDTEGNSYNDSGSPSSNRAWVQYQYE